MKQIKFDITRADVCKRIFATTACTARAREAMGTPPAITERMLATADHSAMLYPLIEESVNEVYGDIARHHHGSTVDFVEDEHGGHYAFDIKVPANYPDGNERKLEHCIASYIAGRALQEWYTNAKPDEAAITAARIQNETTTLQALLTQRIKPTRQEEKL